MKLNVFFEVLDFLGFDIRNPIRLISGASLPGKHSLLHNNDEFALYGFSEDEIDQGSLRNAILSNYGQEYLFWIVYRKEEDWDKRKILATDLRGDKYFTKSFFIFFEPYMAQASLLSFKELVAHLRSPKGCPWDRKQTHESLRTNLIEETYEVIDAIDSRKPESIKEELGDLMLQIVLHAQIAAENGEFNIYDVLQGIQQKIAFRHPHVFNGLQVDGVKGVIRNWEILKAEEKKEKAANAFRSILTSVPKNLPALSLAQKYQERATRVGFDWPDVEPVFEKILEEIQELRSAEDDQSKERELGDLLFAVVNLVRWYGYDAESVLRQMSKRFLKRFQFIETEVSSQGKKLTDLTLAEMDVLWEQSKLLEIK